jgi:hypothetical protein
MACRVLDELLGTPGAARHAVPRRPQLLSVDLRARHRALLETLGSHGLTASDAAQVDSVELPNAASAVSTDRHLHIPVKLHLLSSMQVCAGAPELLAEDASTFQPVLSLLQEQGFEVRIRLACFCACQKPARQAALALVSLELHAFQRFDEVTVIWYSWSTCSCPLAS